MGKDLAQIEDAGWRNSIISMEEKKQSVVCIIGMHRSGTSMVARLLNLCGLDLGSAEDLIGPDAGNPLGHFEHVGFHRIDEALLEHFGGSWANPPELRPGWEQESSLIHFTEEAKRLVGTFAGSALWGWKEPRSTVLLPFWKSLIPCLRFVICVRSPLDVARSLEKRDGISIGAGVYLWNRYLQAAIHDTETSPRIFTFYEDYFGDPIPEINRVAEFCGLSPGSDISHLRETVSQELRHHASETTELFDAEMIPAQYKLFYLGLRVLASQGSAPSSLSQCGSSASTDLAGGLMRLMTEFGEQERVAQLQSALAKKDNEVAVVRSVLGKQLNEKERQIKEIKRQILDIEKQLADLEKQNARLQAFSDAVRGTFVYRFYRKFVRPFGVNVR